MAEETALPNPVIKAEDADKAELRRLVIEEDNKDFTEESTPEPTERETQRAELAESEKPEGEKVEAEKQPEGEPARDELGRFTKADGTKFEPNEAAPKKDAVLNTEGKETKPETNFEKAKKEQERRDRSWKALEAEKLAVRQEAERIRLEREAFEQQRQQRVQSKTFTSDQYEEAAVDFEAAARRAKNEGDVDQAAENFDLAAKARTAANEARKFEQTQKFEQTKGTFEQTWRSGMEATIREIPELGNPDTPLSKQVVELFKTDPVFNYIPDGFRKASVIAQWKLGAEQKAALETENQTLKAEVGRLQKLVSPLGGSPTERTGPMSFENMTHDQQKAALREAAIRQDSQAA